MKLADLAGRATILTNDGGVDVFKATDGTFGPDIHDCYDRWTEFRAAAGAMDTSGAATIDESLLGPPSPRPRQSFGIGLNYKAHAEESGAQLPSIPATFTKFPSCLTGPFATVELPSDNVDWEVELVVVIGVRAHRVARSDGWSHVAGLTIGQDLSERVIQRTAGAQFSLGKSFPGFGPMGPSLVTPDEFADPDDLALSCSIDGEVMQDSRTSQLIFDVPHLVEQLSAVLPLLPGDIIFTGTPDGVGFTRQPPRFLRAGETIESKIEGIGTMRTRCS
jgi:2-keto-4-pentenoate hydratase/2-oxohepta-3-ene-1,7-dioic acid hydratase in catechol pathway